MDTASREEALTGGDRRRRATEPNGPASVLKALHLLDAFRGEGANLRVSDLARETGMPVSTAYRLLAHMVDGGYVRKVGTRYQPGDKLMELGSHVVQQRTQSLREVVAPYLGDLYSKCGSTTRFGVLDGADVIIVDKVVGLQTVPAPTAVGGRVSALCTALGKAQLAFQERQRIEEVMVRTPLPRRTRYSVTSADVLMKQLEQVRSTRIALDREEAVVGQVCLGTPLIVDGRVRGAISVSFPAHRAEFQHSSQALLKTARLVEDAIGRAMLPAAA
jgi:DNA-binding IclR family transcriptional regulator